MFVNFVDFLLKKNNFVFVEFLYHFSILYFIYFHSHHYYLFLHLALDLVCSSFFIWYSKGKRSYSSSIWYCNPTPRHISRENLIQIDTCTPMFIAALFTIAKTWKQPKCPSTDEWIKKVWHIYTVEYYSAIKKRNSIICSEVDGPGVCHTEWSKSEREKQVSYINACSVTYVSSCVWRTLNSLLCNTRSLLMKTWWNWSPRERMKRDKRKKK